jgi:hypothetical protein
MIVCAVLFGGNMERRKQAELREGEQMRLRGKDHEQRLLRLLSGLIGTVEWFKSVRFATHEEDSRGIDLVCDTLQGSVFIQVKSSDLGAVPFFWDVAMGGGTIFPLIVVVVNEFLTDDDILLGCHEEIEAHYNRILTLGYEGAERWFADMQHVNRVLHTEKCTPDHDSAVRLMRFLTGDLNVIPDGVLRLMPWLEELTLWERRGFGLYNGGLIQFKHEDGEAVFLKTLQREAGVNRLEKAVSRSHLRYTVTGCVVPRTLTQSWVEDLGRKLLNEYLMPYRLRAAALKQSRRLRCV